MKKLLNPYFMQKCILKIACDILLPEYLQIRDCLTTPALHTAGDKCSEQWKDRSEHVSNNSLLYTQKDKNNLICR